MVESVDDIQIFSSSHPASMIWIISDTFKEELNDYVMQMRLNNALWDQMHTTPYLLGLA